MADIKDKIRKLLALAGNNPSEHEADSAMRAALKLMAKHNIDSSTFDREVSKIGEMHLNGKGRPWERLLCQAVGRLYFCGYLYTKRSKTVTTHQFIGSEENASVASEIASWLVDAVRREARRAAQGDVPAFNSFCSGAASRINQRVNRIIEEAKRGEITDEATGKSLVLASVYDREEAETSEYIQKLNPRMKKLAIRASDGDAYTRGAQYGDSVGLNRQLGGSTKAKRLA